VDVHCTALKTAFPMTNIESRAEQSGNKETTFDKSIQQKNRNYWSR
jgi:hypothetical protein